VQESDQACTAQLRDRCDGCRWAGRHARGARGQWPALRARSFDHRGAAGPPAVV